MVLGFIPMPHTVTITEAEAVDEWGVVIPTAEGSEVNARVSLNSSRESLNLAEGEEIVFTATIILEGLPVISYDSFLLWVDDYGTEHKSEPLDIKHMRDFSGDPVAIKVVV